MAPAATMYSAPTLRSTPNIVGAIGMMAHSRSTDIRERIGREVVDDAVGSVRRDVLFDQKLDDVGKRLDQTEGPHPIRAETVLKARDDLALHPHEEDIDDHHQQRSRRRHPSAARQIPPTTEARPKTPGAGSATPR